MYDIIELYLPCAWWYTSYLKIGVGDEVGKLVRAGIKDKGDKMSIQKLDIMLGEEDIMRQINPQMYKVFIEIYNTFKELQEQLDKKEDNIDVNDIKEARNINGY